MKKILVCIFSILILTTAFINAFALWSFAAVTKEAALPFDDVKSGAWYTDAAEFCYVNGVITGMDDVTFAPNGQLARTQFVTMLANLENVDLAKCKRCH
ncbi:MAG: S-layer homology domain-containing protein [Clostridia bacterium]|nr:S-layer homology domain-containing protein [Clostridia bacterium]